jgi:hypothetical protein
MIFSPRHGGDGSPAGVIDHQDFIGARDAPQSREGCGAGRFRSAPTAPGANPGVASLIPDFAELVIGPAHCGPHPLVQPSATG